MDGLVHQVLQTARLLKVISVFRIENLEEDLLNIGLIRLVLDDLAEFYPVYFSSHQPLDLIEQALLLGQNGLKSRCYLRCHQDLVD